MVRVRHTVAEAFLNLYQAAILLNPACGYSNAEKVTPVQRCMASRATGDSDIMATIKARVLGDIYRRLDRISPGLRDLRQAVGT